jgi:hypothetical protein
MGKALGADLSATLMGFYDGALNLDLASSAVSGGGR